jgi:putative heme-binding domain-containing protein
MRGCILIWWLAPAAIAAQTVAAGREVYSKFCAPCHGADARGGEGPNLHRSRVVVTGTHGALAGLVRKGIPGTSMIPFPIPDQQIDQLVSFLHGLTRPGEHPPLPGNPANGGALFRSAGCVNCHMVNGAGGVIGPDLGSVALRLFPDQIRRAIIEPGAAIAEGFRTVSVRLRSGGEIRGVLKREDNFSLQVLATDGQFALLLRDETASVTIEQRSLMPAIGAKLPANDLRDLLAYLDRQRAPRLTFTLTFQNY